MIVAFTDNALAVDIALTSAGRSYPADGGSAAWTLLGANMAPIAGLVDQPLTLTPGATSVTVTVPSSGNTKTADVESRFVRLAWMSGGATRQTHLGYVVTDWAPVSATADEARLLVGASQAEVPDADFNIWKAWLQLRSQIGSAEALARLTSTDGAAERMNQAIACRAAINVAQHMALRLAVKMSSETVSFQRFAELDLEGMIRSLSALEARLLDPETADTTAAPAAFFQLSGVAADAVTGG